MLGDRRTRGIDPHFSSDAHAAEPGAADRVRRLVPSSSLQFIDVAIDASILPMMRQWFTEDGIESPTGKRRVLLPLAADSGNDGTIWHPVTFRPLGPTETLSFTGLEAVEPFLDSWIPVPYLRFLGNAETGSPHFDQGPMNWARVFVAKPVEGLRGADKLEAVFAFDTRLDARSRADQAAYLAPNRDDAMFSSTFRLVDAPEHLATFLGAAWVDSWLRDSCAEAVNPYEDGFADLEEAGFAKTARDQSRFTLAHIARYLTFLKLLQSAASPPQIRFVDSVSKAVPIPRSGVDLVVDFGPSSTTALLFERNRSLPPDLAKAMREAIPLRMRDLAHPVTTHTGDIATVVEFDNQTFGSAALSRRSGRADAFAWTSLVRIGAEAQRLALRVNATEGVTGLRDIASGLDQTAASGSLWRFSTADGGTRSSPMVTGEALRHMSEAGDLVPRADGLLAGPRAGADSSGAPGQDSAPTPAMRPRFSQSSLIGFFVVELLLHTIGEINSADPASPFPVVSGQGTTIRHIERVVIASPLAMPTQDRQLLIERVHNAIDLVWRTQQWDQPDTLDHPVKPQLILGLGPDVGLQLVYLFSSVRDTFNGAFSELVDCLRRRTGDQSARDTLRISSIELGQRTAGLMVIDYDIAHDGTVQAQLVTADRTGRGGDRVISGIVDEHILPTLEAQLAACGLADPRGFLLALPMAADEKGASGGAFATRLATKVLRPAAVAIFQTYARAPRQGGGIQRFRLDALVAAGGGRLDPLSTQFNAAAQAAGASGFDLASLTLVLGQRHVKRLVENELWPAVTAMTDAIERSRSDLLLLGGELATLPDLLDHVLARAPVAAGRIVVIGSSGTGTDAAGVDDPKTQALLGAYMASRDLLVTTGFSLRTRDISQALVQDRVSQFALGSHNGRSGPANDSLPTDDGVAAFPAPARDRSGATPLSVASPMPPSHADDATHGTLSVTAEGAR